MICVSMFRSLKSVQSCFDKLLGFQSVLTFLFDSGSLVNNLLRNGPNANVWG